MAGDVRGHDLDSWWQNRAAYRLEASRAADQWRAVAARYSKAAGGAKPAALTVAPNETLENLGRLGESTLASLENVRYQLTALDGERQEAQSDFAAEQVAIQDAGRQRTLAERKAAQNKAYETKVQLEKSKTVLRKFGALAIFAIVLYAIIHY
jgi:hypothetical protein